MLEMAVLFFFPAVMAFAGSSDFFTMKIPNYISMALVGGFVLLAPFAGMTMDTFLVHLAVFAIVLVVCFGLFAGNFIGGGDAKLLATTSLWFGWPLVISFLLNTALFGGVLAVILVSIRRFELPAGLMKHEFVARLHEGGGAAPYGIAIAASALLVYPVSFWMKALAG